MTRSQALAERAADTAEQRYHAAPRGRRLYRLTLVQTARLRALDAGNRAARRNVRAKERANG